MDFRFCGVWLQEIWTSFYCLLVCDFQRNVKSFLLSSTSIKNKITVTRISIKTFYLDCFLKHFCNLLLKKSFSISMVAALFFVCSKFFQLGREKGSGLQANLFLCLMNIIELLLHHIILKIPCQFYHCLCSFTFALFCMIIMIQILSAALPFLQLHIQCGVKIKKVHKFSLLYSERYTTVIFCP